MLPGSDFRRRGFTRLDLAVAIVVGTVTIAAAIPAVYSANVRDDRTACMGRMRRLAMAAFNYESTKRQYPGYSNAYRLSNGKVFTDPKTGDQRGVSWVVPLLTYLDQAALDQQWREPGNATVAEMYKTENSDASVFNIPTLVCPADVNMSGKKCGLSYVANCGMKDGPGAAPPAGTKWGVPRDWPENGVFFDLFLGNPLVGRCLGNPDGAVFPQVRMSNDYIARGDGIGQTCMLSENVDAGRYIDDTEAAAGMIWNGSGMVDISQDPPSLKPPDPGMRILAGAKKPSPPVKDLTVHARPSSPHARGVNMAFCDGRVRFVRDDMDYYVYCELMSTNGPRVRMPGSTQVLMNFDRPIDERWYLHE